MASGIQKPSGAGGTALTATQIAKLASLPLPDEYDDGRALIARTLGAVSSDVKLALNVDSAALTDVSASAHTVTLEGAAAISTDEFFAGDSSIHFEGDDGDDRATIPQSTDFDPTTGEFDIQIAAMIGDDPGTPVTLPFAGVLIGKWEDGTNLSWQLALTDGATQNLVFSYSTAGSNTASVSVDITGLISSNAWHAYRACRIGDLLLLFVDEVMVGTGDMTGVDIWDEGSSEIAIGNNSVTNKPWDGYIDAPLFQKAGTIIPGEYIVQRRLYSGSAQVIYQPEQTLLPESPGLIDADRTLSPVDGEQLYRFTGAYTATLPAMSTWGKWVPHLFNDESGVTPEIEYDDADSIDGVLGSAGNITLPTQYGHCKLRKQTSNTAIAEGRFSQP